MKKIAIIGLGYVGIPLAVEFGKFFETIGFDININRINDLKKGVDTTFELSSEELLDSKYLTYTTYINDIKDCNIFIVTVPTPVDKFNTPDLSYLENSSELIATILKKDDIVIYESTVYPGATEEFCVPILERLSGLEFNQDFYCGYSPERINPGDKVHRINSIQKITSGSTVEVAEIVDKLYKKIITAGTYKASCIKVAEAAKVIENTQRDVNIALINELALIFNKLEIDTQEVLEAASTKWNFLNFKPGLVGGHCISVDPYYLTYKAMEVGYKPDMILAGRKLNDNMGKYIANQVIKLMSKKNIPALKSNILIMGLTFKENCPDVRNSGVFNIIEQLNNFSCNIDVFDPWVNNNQDKFDSNTNLVDSPLESHYDAIIIAVNHDIFKDIPIKKIRSFGKDVNIVYDVKHLFAKSEVDGRL